MAEQIEHEPDDATRKLELALEKLTQSMEQPTSSDSTYAVLLEGISANLARATEQLASIADRLIPDSLKPELPASEEEKKSDGTPGEQKSGATPPVPPKSPSPETRNKKDNTSIWRDIYDLLKRNLTTQRVREGAEYGKKLLGRGEKPAAPADPAKPATSPQQTTGAPTKIDPGMEAASQLPGSPEQPQPPGKGRKGTRKPRSPKAKGVGATAGKSAGKGAAKGAARGAGAGAARGATAGAARGAAGGPWGMIIGAAVGVAMSMGLDRLKRGKGDGKSEPAAAPGPSGESAPPPSEGGDAGGGDTASPAPPLPDAKDAKAKSPGDIAKKAVGTRQDYTAAMFGNRPMLGAAVSSGQDVFNAKSLPDAIAKLRRFSLTLDLATTALLNQNKAYAELSASMAQVFAEREGSEILRGIEMGERTSGSARFLMESEQYKKDSQKNIDAFIQNMENLLGALTNYAAGIASWPVDTLIHTMLPILPYVSKWFGVQEEQAVKGLEAWVWAEKQAEQGEKALNQARQRMRNL